MNLVFKSSPKDMLINFRQRGRKGERDEEKRGCEREPSISCLLYASWLGTEPAAQEHALLGLNPRPFSLQTTLQPTAPLARNGNESWLFLCKSSWNSDNPPQFLERIKIRTQFTTSSLSGSQKAIFTGKEIYINTLPSDPQDRVENKHLMFGGWYQIRWSC